VDEDFEEGGQLLPTVMWWFASAGIVLMLPRQWFAAGGCFLVALALRGWLRLQRHDEARSIVRESKDSQH
jgi:uncharacterized membrane protein YfcA